MNCPKCQNEIPEDSTYCGKCGTRIEAPGEFAATRTLQGPKAWGVVVGKYKLQEEIGRGGMGVVYKAEDTQLNRSVALKFLSPDLTAEPAAKQRFIQEAQAAARLDHPNICTVYEIGEHEGRTFISMAFVKGKSLKEVLLEGPLDPSKALDIVIQAASGLAKAHEEGIIHRDVKPGNIMLSEDCKAKIVDFGLAKLSGEARLTRTEATLGTVAYMSPEQAQGKTADQRTDIWSLGVAFYEMLSGELPFPGENEGALIHSIIRKAVPSLRKRNPAITAGTEQVVLKSLEKDPAGRYQTMEDFLSDLEALAEGLRPHKAKFGLMRGRIFGVPKPAFYGLVAALAVVAGLFLPHKKIPERQAISSVAVLPISNISGDPGLDNLAIAFLDDTISNLYRIGSLDVKPRSDVMKYRELNKDLREIAKELGVKALVESSLQKSENEIRLTVRLIDPFAKNNIIGQHELKRDVSEVSKLPDDFALAVADSTKAAVPPVVEYRLTTGRSVVPAAYDLYAQGVRLVDGRFLDAIDCFEKAVRIDPSFVLAYAVLADAYESGAANNALPAKDAYAKAEKAVLRALELDENSARAHSALADLLTYKGDHEGAEREYAKALSIAPGDTWIKTLYYEYLVYQKGEYDEAIEGMRTLLARDPKWWMGLRKLPIYLLAAGHYEEAFEEAKKSASASPNFLYDLFEASALALMGRHEEAVSLAEKMRVSREYKKGLYHEPVLTSYACILALAGRTHEAHRVLEELQSLLAERKEDSFYPSACVYAALGNKDEAFRLLEEARKSHSAQLPSFRSDWWLHRLHDDPRFEEMLRKMGLPISPSPR